MSLLYLSRILFSNENLLKEILLCGSNGGGWSITSDTWIPGLADLDASRNQWPFPRSHLALARPEVSSADRESSIGKHNYTA